MQKYPMTVSGEAKLKEELKRLKSIERPRIIEAIATARALGDLKENAEYHAAREQQSFIEGRILDLEGKLANSQVIDVKTIPNNGKIIFGTTVTVINQEGDAFTYKIVGEDEVDLKNNKISYASPLGKSLIGKMLDDVVVVKTPDGDIQYEVSLVEYI